MMKNKPILILSLVLILLIGGACILYPKLAQEVDTEDFLTESSPPPTEPDDSEEPDNPYKAPDITVYDRDGNPVHLSDFVGKPIVLNFWASWCSPCKSEMPDFNEKYLEHGDEVQFLMVNVTSGRETLESATSFIDQSGYSSPVFYDTDNTAALTCGAYSLPSTFFIDAEGNGVTYYVGILSSELLQKGIDLITE
jgi:thiol-disulfide isomerase/thioredoxin